MKVPTVGDVVWFYPAPESGQGLGPLPATVCLVHDTGAINLGGHNAVGSPVAATSVGFVQDGETPPKNGYYATWPGKPTAEREPAKAEPAKAAPAKAQPVKGA